MSQAMEAMIRLGRGRAGKVATLALAGVAAAAIAPAVASADPPRIQTPPHIEGTAQVGQTLRAEGAQYSGASSVVWRWWRCTGPQPDSDDCDTIDGADRTSYKLVDADRNKTIRVLLFVSNRDGWRYAVSGATSRVTSAPPPPTPTPSPTPNPSPTPTPSPAPQPLTPSTPSTPSTPGTVPDTGGVLPETITRPARMMTPAPLVRIRGRMTSNGVRITLLTVRAPKGARIALTCKGSSCPAKKWGKIASLARVVKFERRLRAGTRLTIAITKAGRIGKFTTIKIRRGKAPKRTDRCIYPGARKPVACPGS